LLPTPKNINDLIKPEQNRNFGVLKRELKFEYIGKSVDLQADLAGLSLTMDIGVFKQGGLFVLANPSSGNVVLADPTDIESNRMALKLGPASQSLIQFHTIGDNKHFLAWVEKSSNKIHLFYTSELNLPVFKAKIEEMFLPTEYEVLGRVIGVWERVIGVLGKVIGDLAFGTIVLGCCYWYTVPSMAAVTTKTGKKITKETSKKTQNKITANKPKQRSKTHPSH